MKKVYFVFISLIFLFTSCKNRINDSKDDKKERILHKDSALIYDLLKKENDKKEKAFTNYINAFSLHDKVCQLFIVNLEGDKTYIPVEKDYIPGGYLFFSYNLAPSAKEIMSFTDSIHSYCLKHNKLCPFLAIDQEGGYVNRLRTVCGPLPSAKRVSQKLDVQSAYKLYSLQARQMKALGFNMNLAPVVEVETAQNADFLDGRSFGSYIQVRSYGTACVNAFENRGIATVIKHFPGNTNTDPHTGLAEINLTMEELDKLLIPFKQVCRANPKGVLMSHARTTSLSPTKPACFSSEWINEKLVNGMNYSGIVFSDDIFMGALKDNGYPQETASIKAIEAGINCIMISEKRIKEPANALIEKAENDKEFLVLIQKSYEKIMRYKLSAGFFEYDYDNSGELIIKPKNPIQTDIKTRLESFNANREQNIDLYQTYF